MNFQMQEQQWIIGRKIDEKVAIQYYESVFFNKINSKTENKDKKEILQKLEKIY